MTAAGAKRIEALVEALAASHPDRVAMIFGERRWTYAALRAEMDRRAAMLVEAGLAAGDVVATNATVPDDVYITFAACCRAGVPLLPLSPRLTATEFAALTARACARAVLTVDGAPHPADPTLPPLPLDLPGEPSTAARAEALARSASGTADAVAVVQPTSGTTGTPKLILLPHRQMTWLAGTRMWWEAPDDRFYLPPPHPLYGFIFALGGTAFLSHTTHPAGMEAEMAATGATALWIVPPFLRLLAEQPTPPPAGVHIRTIRTGAVSIPGEIERAIEERYGARLVQEYGSMETGRLMYTPEDGMPDEGIGVCYPGVDVRLVDEDGRDVPDGQTGELIARSPGMMLGYVDDPIATARAFLGDWFRTGDLAWRDAAGRYYLAGRATLRINVGGLKVAPEEVETVLAQHPAVREAVVFANPDAGRGEVVWAAIIPRDPAPTAAELRRFCRERLAPHKVPRGFEFYEEFPRSLLGKVLRSQLTS